MPTVQINNANIHYSDVGSGPETLFFVHGLAFDGRMFEAQIAHFQARYRCIAMDLRGHGQSELTEGGYDMDDLASDAATLIRHLGVGAVHFIGWSIGGFMGMRLASRQPELIRSLTLIGTASMNGSETDFGFKLVPSLTRWFGMRAVQGALMKSMFSPSFLKDPARAELREQWRQRFVADRALGVSRAASGVIRQSSVDTELTSLRTPTLVVRGEFDAVVPLAAVRRTFEKIPNAKFVAIERGGHGCTIEEPEQVKAAMEEFLSAN